MKEVRPDIFRGPKPRNVIEVGNLVDSGIRSIINLEEGWSRIFGHRHEEEDFYNFAKIRQVRVNYTRISLSNIFPPTPDECRIISDIIVSDVEQNLKPVYIHCYAGVDRTGFIVAYHLVKEYQVHPEVAWHEAITEGMHKRYSWWWKKYFMQAVERIKR